MFANAHIFGQTIFVSPSKDVCFVNISGGAMVCCRVLQAHRVAETANLASTVELSVMKMRVPMDFCAAECGRNHACRRKYAYEAWNFCQFRGK